MSENKIYPNTFFSVGRKNFVLAANLNVDFAKDADLAKAKLGPYSIFGKYAGIGLNFVESDSDFKNECRIPFASLEDILLRTNYAVQKIAETPVTSSDSMNMEMKFVPGHSDLRNKPVLEVAAALGFDEGMRVVQQMVGNDSRYAARNKQAADILTAALIIMNAKQNGISTPAQLQGRTEPIVTQLNNILAQHPEYWDAVTPGQTTSSNSGEITIYDAQMKTPNTRDVSQDGYTKVYSLTITAKPGSDMPITIIHKLGKGKPIVNNGIVAPVGIQSGSYVPVHTFVVSLTSAEWCHIVSHARNMFNGLIACQAGNAYTAAHQLMQNQFQNKQQAQYQQPAYQQPNYQQQTYQQPQQYSQQYSQQYTQQYRQ